MKICLKGINLADNVELQSIVLRTDGYSGADLANLCR